MLILYLRPGEVRKLAGRYQCCTGDCSGEKIHRNRSVELSKGGVRIESQRGKGADDDDDDDDDNNDDNVPNKN